MPNILKNLDDLWSKSAEAAVLGSMLIEPKCIPEVCAVIHRADWFFLTAHRHLFDAIVMLNVKQDESIDAVLLRGELLRVKRLDEAGGVEYIGKILDSVPSSANVVYYAKIVKSKHLFRNMIKVVQEISEIGRAHV